jgi:hypothetical protein
MPSCLAIGNISGAMSTIAGRPFENAAEHEEDDDRHAHER